MTEHTSIRVTVDAKERAEESKRDDETWNEYIQRCTDNPPEVKEFVEASGGLGDEIYGLFEDAGCGVGEGELERRLDRLEEAIKEATNAAQSADRKLEGLR